MGTSTGPKLAVAHAIMPVMSVDPSRKLPKWGCRGAERMVYLRHLALTGSPGAPYIALYRSLQRHKTRLSEISFLNLQEECIHHIPSDIQV